MWCFLLMTLFVTVQGRAVNISNTWVLPEEGFPVFYRYFRDRISWYEADAVCQFHHANLVTVDTTAQYDAVRAYLKELDISSAVWVGLIRSNPDGDFTWTDYRGLSGDGYWSAGPDTRSAPLCAAADPAADYRWEARACGGPSVASFICELPVPQWALGNEGCMVRALPAVTVLYLPESAAVQLTADCGLAGVKRVQCTGNMKRDELLKELACAEEDQTSPSNGSSPSTQWQITTDSVFTNQDTNNEVSMDENVTTEHEDDINQSTSLKVISTSYSILPDVSNRLSPKPFFTNTLYKIPLHKNVNLDINSNNLRSNETPKQDSSDDFFNNEQSGKFDDENLLQHTKLHDELARLGNVETIFSQPTDHFVPPLVMAKSKISDDMTALSIEEKLAQQLAERQFIKYNIQQNDMATANNIKKELFSTESYNSTLTTTLPSSNFITSSSSKENNNEQTRHIMHTMPKKYSNKYDVAKHIIVKNYVPKSFDSPGSETTSISSKINTKSSGMTSTIKTITDQTHRDNIYTTKPHLVEEATLELTVIVKDPPINQSNGVNYITTTDSPLLVNTIINENNIKYNKNDLTSSSQNFLSSTTANHVIKDVIDIKLFEDQNNHSDAVLDVSTLIPIYKQSTELNTENMNNDTLFKKPVTVFSFINRYNPTTITVDSTTTSIHYVFENVSTTDGVIKTTSDIIPYSTGELDINLNFNSTARNTSKANNISETPLSNDRIKENFDDIIDSDFDLERNNTDISSEIDDFQSPLLSGASEPLHKPNRSRRPQQQNRNKFNPFRILG